LVRFINFSEESKKNYFEKYKSLPMIPLLMTPPTKLHIRWTSKLRQDPQKIC